MNSKTKKMANIALVAALYATITMALGFISYGPIQFRIAEVMTLLPLFGKEYIVALTLGCFIANIMSAYGLADIILGTLATLISVYLVYITGKKMRDKKSCLLVASLWPTIVNAIIVGGVMLHGILKLPLMLTMLEVGFGQFVVITIIGVPLFKVLEKKYSSLLKNAFR